MLHHVQHRHQVSSGILQRHSAGICLQDLCSSGETVYLQCVPGQLQSRLRVLHADRSGHSGFDRFYEELATTCAYVDQDFSGPDTGPFERP